MQKIIDYYDCEMKKVKRSYTLRHGKKHGLFIEYFLNGKPSIIKPYDNNLLEGICTEYHENGCLKSSVSYNQGSKHGQQLIYYPNSKIFKILNYKFGYPHGKWYSYYDNDIISIKSFDHFLYGKHINKSFTYYDNKIIKSITTYNYCGQRNGVCKRFFNNQQIMSSKYYKNDKLHGQTVDFYQNGNKKRILYHLDGKLNGTVFKYSQDNELQFKCHYIDDKRHGYSYEYYVDQDQKMLKRAVNYEYGKKTGRAFLYDSNGNPNFLFEYKNDKFHGIQLNFTTETEDSERYMIENKIILQKRSHMNDCSICYEKGNTWKTTCGHYICIDCCDKYYNNINNKNFKCFYCRQSFLNVNLVPELIFN